ncbi:MAG: DNA-processing protein DprA, partial [Longimicrobiales bacterium]
MSADDLVADDRLRDLLHLRALPGIGDVRFRRLLDHYGDAERALRAPAETLGREAAAARGSRAILGRVERALDTIAEQQVVVRLRGERGYPRRLEQLAVPPPLLFARGRLELLRGPAMTVVGSRRATEYGLDAARLLSADLARAGFVIVSGLARGIDRAAHDGALAVRGDTVAVVGCGIDVSWPREHASLQERIAREGLLLSEFLPGEPPLRHNFPRRNRLLAALGLGVLVVEAGTKSGARSTVDHALDLGRDVFAVPGPIGRETSAGTNALIQQGATLVTEVGDMLSEVRPAVTRTARQRSRLRERAGGAGEMTAGALRSASGAASNVAGTCCGREEATLASRGRLATPASAPPAT